MKSFFQRLLNPGGRPAGAAVAPRLTLAAFGKHPGWNDHIPGIGVETEALAHVKHAMYVSGLGGRIDAGAWKALEPGKRLEGFDHTFLWLRPGHVILGRMHSSEDGLHRKEYPMVLCVDAEGLAPEFVLARCGPELDGLRAACRATTSAEQVAAECRRVEDRLRAGLVSPAPAPMPSMLPVEARRRFLEHPALGPERLGLLRALHELGSGGEAGSGRRGADAGTNGRSRHLRLPLAADSRSGALLLWTEFLRCAVAAPTPLLLIARDETDWLDVIIGEPVSDDFFCLQASLKALALVSQIPYELTPELKPRLQELESRFLRAESSPLPGTQGAAGSSAAPPPATATAAETLPPQQGINPLIFFAIGAAVLAAGLAVWLFRGEFSSPPEAKPLTAGSNSVSPKTPVAARAEPAPPRKADESAAAAARLQAEADAKRLAEEKKSADAKAAEEARLKSLAPPPAKVANETAPPPVKPRAEDDSAQARTRQNDADLAQIALAQGNYERAAEICQKWPGQDLFKPLSQRIAAETNQLGQAGEMLKAGKYEPLLSQRLPENSKFREILTQAASEKKLLDQAGEEFAGGRYDFLQRPEVQALKSKPPFQKLLQDGAAEWEQLKQAQGLKTQNKPQAVLDFIGPTLRQKPAFAQLQQWAATELAQQAGVQRDRQSAEAAFQQGEYDRALELCRKHAGQPVFDTLSQRSAREQDALADARKKFSGGDYAFLKGLEGREYKTKPPFAELLRQGAAEQAALGELEKLKQAGDWQALPGKLGALAPAAAGKPPFADLRQWAQAKADEQAALRKKDPVWLDSEFEALLVKFNICKPTDPRIKTPAARQEKALVGTLNLAGVKYYLDRVSALENEYKQGGWLDQDDRKKLLKDLRERINSAN